ncbi:MAG: BrnT family toxin [Legionellales bacterium]|jgi:hypothetical protein
MDIITMSFIYEYDPKKNILLKNQRGISFDEVIYYIDNGHVIDIVDNPKYENQKFYVINIEGYIHLVPFVKDKNIIFLKTIYPSRKMTKSYLKEE